MERDAFDSLFRDLRNAGLRIGAGEVLRVHHVLTVSGATRPEDLRCILQATLAKSTEQRALVGQHFDRWLEEVGNSETATGSEEGQAPPEPDVGPSPPPLPPGAPKRGWHRWLLGAALPVTAIAAFAISRIVLPDPGADPTPKEKEPPALQENVGDAGPVAAHEEAKPATYVETIPKLEVRSPDRYADLKGPISRAALAGALLIVLYLVARLRRQPPMPLPPPRGGGPTQPRLVPLGTRRRWLLTRDQESDAVWGAEVFVSEDAGRDLDVQATVRETARSGGFPSFRFRHRRLRREVWIWRDEAAYQTEVDQFARELAEALGESGVSNEVSNFYGFPSALAGQGGSGAQDRQDRSDAALILVCTDGRAMESAFRDRVQKRRMLRQMRELAAWPHLAFVDFGFDQHRLRALTQPAGLRVLDPEDVAAWLGSPAQPSDLAESRAGAADSEVKVWAACCALSPEPVDAGVAHQLRSKLGLRCPSWSFRYLRSLSEVANEQLHFRPETKLELVAWLRTVEDEPKPSQDPDERTLLQSALHFWMSFYEESAARLERLRGPEWKERAEAQRLESSRLLLELWLDPECAAELYPLFRGELVRFLRAQLTQLEPADAPDDSGRLRVFWPRRAASKKAWALLEEMGFGGKTGVSARESLRPSTVRWGAAAAATVLGVFGLSASAGGVFTALPPVVNDSAINSGLYWRRTQALGNLDREYEVTISTPSHSTVVHAGSKSVVRLDFTSRTGPCRKELGNSVLVRCGGSGGNRYRIAIAWEELPTAEQLMRRGDFDAILVGAPTRAQVEEVLQPAMGWGDTKRDIPVDLIVFDPKRDSVDWRQLLPAARNRVSAARVPRLLSSAVEQLTFEGTRKVNEVWPNIERLTGERLPSILGRLEESCPKQLMIVNGKQLVRICPAPVGEPSKAFWLNRYLEGMPDNLAVETTWEDADSRCTAFGLRLPSADELELATRQASALDFNRGGPMVTPELPHTWTSTCIQNAECTILQSMRGGAPPRTYRPRSQPAYFRCAGDRESVSCPARPDQHMVPRGAQSGGASGACTYQCAGGWEDQDRDLDRGSQGTGCECAQRAWYTDRDNDNFGGGQPKTSCVRPGEQFTTTGGDCDDSDPDTHPKATEFWPGPLDTNCDGKLERRWTQLKVGCGALQDRCDPGTPGWEGTVPACGKSARFYTGCKAAETAKSPTSQTPPADGKPAGDRAADAKVAAVPIRCVEQTEVRTQVCR